MRLNKRRDAVYADLMERLEEQGVRLVDFRKIGRQESERLNAISIREIAPLISPSSSGAGSRSHSCEIRIFMPSLYLNAKTEKQQAGHHPATRACSAAD